MSLKSFLAKVWSDIEQRFSKLPAELQSAAHIAVIITESLKTVVDNPAVDILTLVIPGTIDDKIVTWLRGKLPFIITELKLVDVTKGLSGSEVVAEAVKVIQSLDGDIKNAFLHDLSILIAQEVAKAQDGTLSWSDAVYVVEWYYKEKFQSANA